MLHTGGLLELVRHLWKKEVVELTSHARGRE